MNHELFLGLLAGLSLAGIYATLHLMLLRILWKPLKKHTPYARWVHRFVNPTLMLIFALTAGFAGLSMEAPDQLRQAILPATIAGILAYFAAIIIFLYPKIWAKKETAFVSTQSWFFARSKKAHQ